MSAKKCRYGKLKRPIGRRRCKPKPKLTSRQRKASAARTAKHIRQSNKIRRSNALYDKLTTAEKAAWLKKKLPGMEQLIDENPQFYGYRKRRR